MFQIPRSDVDFDGVLTYLKLNSEPSHRAKTALWDGQHMLCHFASIVTSSFADIKAVLLFAMLCLHYQGRMLALFLIICCILFSVVALDPSGL